MTNEMASFGNTPKNIIHKHYVPIILFIVTVFVLLQSPLAPFANKDAGSDSGVFVYCAKQILAGHLMYREVFDHKGPLIYLIDMIGLLIMNGNLTGIWLVELISLFVAAIFMFKAANLFVRQLTALLSTTYALLTLTSVLLDGNFTQEYALAFISISLYLFCKYFTNGKHLSAAECSIIIICFVMVTMLLPTYVISWIGFGLIVLIDLLITRRYSLLFRLALLSVIVTTATISPFLIYFLEHGTLSDAISCFWTFNRAFSNTSVTSIIKSVYFSCYYIDKAYAFILITFYILYISVNFRNLENKSVHSAIFTTLLLTMVIGCGLSGHPSKHYSIIYVPIISIIVAFILEYVRLKLNLHNSILIIAIFLLSWRVIILHIYYLLPIYKPNKYINNIVSIIDKYTNPTDTIAIVGDNSKLYYMSDRNSFSKYNFTNPIISVKGYKVNILNEYCFDLLANKPRMVLVNAFEYPTTPDCINDILAKNYTKIYDHDPLADMLGTDPVVDAQSAHPIMDIYVLK